MEMEKEREPHLFRNIVNTLHDALVVLDARLRVVTANTSFYRLFRTTPEETERRPLFELGDGQWNIPGLKTLLESILPRRRVLKNFTVEHEFPRIGKRVMRLNAARIVSPDDTVDLILLAIEDVTERTRTEQTLVETKNRLQAILDASGEIIFAKDREGRYTMANAAFSRIFNLPLERIIGKRDEDLFPPQEAARIRKVDARVLAAGEPLTTEDVLTVGGERRTFLATKVPLRDERGNITGLCGFAEDVTEKRQIEERKKELERRLEQARRMEAVGRLAGGVAHDFNNMLSIILGNAQLLQGALEPRSPLAGYAGEIIDAARRAGDLTRQLLAFARRQTASPRVIDLNEFIESQEKMLRRLIREDIEITFVPAEDLWHVKIDPGQAEQILINLVINARDAIRDGGSILIETANVTISGEYSAFHAEAEPGEFVMLAVTDTGKGMDPETASHVFEPFFTTKNGKGTGLGLSTVHGIVKQNGGFINVYSEIDQGTTFKIYLPRAKAPVEEPHPPKPAAGPPPGTATVLVVEDEKHILEMCRTFLEQLGYTVLTASSPREALDLAGRHPGEIHVLVTDIVMPEMNGRELESRLREKHPRIRTLFMSGYTVNVVAHRGLLEEGIQFIQKPFELPELAEKIGAVLSGGGTE